MKEQLNAGIIKPELKSPTGEFVHYISAGSTQSQQRCTVTKQLVSGWTASSTTAIWSFVEEQDATSLHHWWYKKKRFYKSDWENKTGMHNDFLTWVISLRLTRVIYGSGPSPFILNTSFQKNVEPFEEEVPETTEALLEDTYVDDIQSGGDYFNELVKFKEESTKIMGADWFELQ